MTISQDSQAATAAPTITSTSGTTKPTEGETWEEIGARKRAALLASLPKEWIVPSELLPPASQDDVTTWPETSGWFTPEELAITNLSATELVAKLTSGALKSVDATKAFCKRAVAAHQLVSLLPYQHSWVEVGLLSHVSADQLRTRPTVSRRHASSVPSRRPHYAMSTTLAPASP